MPALDVLWVPFLGEELGQAKGKSPLELAVAARRLEELVRQRIVLVVRLVMTVLVMEHRRS